MSQYLDHIEKIDEQTSDNLSSFLPLFIGNHTGIVDFQQFRS